MLVEQMGLLKNISRYPHTPFLPPFLPPSLPHIQEEVAGAKLWRASESLGREISHCFPCLACTVERDVCVYAYVYKCVCKYIYIYIYIYVCVCLCARLYMCVVCVCAYSLIPPSLPPSLPE